jgi:hypothetical protein
MGRPSAAKRACMDVESDQHLVCLHCHAASTFNPRLLLSAPATAPPRYSPPIIPSYTHPSNRPYAPHAAPRRAGPSSTRAVCRRFTSTHPRTAPSRLPDRSGRPPSAYSPPQPSPSRPQLPCAACLPPRGLRSRRCQKVFHAEPTAQRRMREQL